MADFAPGIASMRSAGIPVTVAPYAPGSAGIRQSLDAMALKMREGKVDARVIGWTGQVLRDAGLDGRSGATTDSKRVAALLDAYRAKVIYTPDPYGTEMINSAAATLCLSKDLCLNRGDCDDGSVALGSATLSLGIPTQIVKQNFGPDAQEHVLIAVHTDGDWRYADPSTNLPFGKALQAVDELWVDPMGAVGSVPEAAPQIVTLGRPHTGAGALLGYATVADLVDLLKVAAFNMVRLQAAADACPNGFDNAIEWTWWQRDLAIAKADLATATTAASSVINSTPHLLQGWNVITYQWGLVKAVIDEQIDLDRRWRQFGGTNCAPADFTGTPQPTSFDVDQWTYQAADSTLKGVENVAKNATQPLVIGTGGIVLGVGLTVGAFFLLDRLIPHRR
jgi:hypothetical protein